MRPPIYEPNRKYARYNINFKKFKQMNFDMSRFMPSAQIYPQGWYPFSSSFPGQWNWETCFSYQNGGSQTWNSSFVSRNTPQTPPSQSQQVQNFILKEAAQSSSKNENEVKRKLKRTQGRRVIQKDSRNVLSNLLRIFLRNLIEHRSYQALAHQILDRRNLKIKLGEFYSWVDSFDINFKGYIRTNQLQKLFGTENREQFRTLLKLLIERFISHEGTIHCLTSKRIGAQAAKLHLQGLRQLRLELAAVTKQGQ